MSKWSDKDRLAYMFARRLLYLRDAIDGMTVLNGGQVMTVPELCEVGREALRLIEDGLVLVK